MRTKIILAAVIVTIAVVFGFVVVVPAIVASIPAPAMWGHCLSTKCSWLPVTHTGTVAQNLKNIANWGTCHATKCTW